VGGPTEEDLADIALWDTIVKDKKCPKCGAHNSMLTGEKTELAMHILCSKCEQRFWMSPIRVLGASYVEEKTDEGTEESQGLGRQLRESLEADTERPGRDACRDNL